MQKIFVVLITVLFQFNFCKAPSNQKLTTITISKIEMNLSAFGVESDRFPDIHGYVNFINDSASFIKSYYNPGFKGSTYTLSHEEIEKIKVLFQNVDLYQLKSEYAPNLSDQPTSTITIYTKEKSFIIKDSGLIGDYPLQDLYKLAYKF